MSSCLVTIDSYESPFFSLVNLFFPQCRTNHDDALTALGVTQVEDACNYMMANEINPSVVKYSLAAKCIDSTNIVATGMMVSIYIHEYSFISIVHRKI